MKKVAATVETRVEDFSNVHPDAGVPSPASETSGDPARWEFNDRRKLLYALVGNDFGPDPESKLDEIRAYKKNESHYLIDSLQLALTDRVFDLGSGCGFIARVTAPLCERLYCLDISNEFLDFCKDELHGFPNVEFHRIDFADLSFLKNKGITKGYANAVFIHFNFFDITLYLSKIFDILEPGGLFVFGMSDTDCLDIKNDRYFGVVLEKYKENRGSPTLMHWNSSKAVCSAATQIGFVPKSIYSADGSAMILLQKPALSLNASLASAPPKEIIAALQKWSGTMAGLRGLAQDLVSRFPQDREARYLFAEILRGSGLDDLALAEYKSLANDCPANELHRVRQGIEQCEADKDYFPPAFAERLTTAEYAAGHNAAVWREYARREIQRGREIVRTLRQVTTLRGKRVLDVGSGYGGMLISMAEQGAAVTGVEIDPERARMGRRRLADLGMQIPYHEADICEPNMPQRLGTFDIVVCQDVLEHVLDPTTVIRSLCAMMNPGGLIFIQIPNKYGIDQLMSDHHYALTGLTALSRPQAIEYWQLATGENPAHYSVGYERGEKYYRAAFARCGVALNPVEQYAHIDHVLWYAPHISAMCKRLEREIYPGLRSELQHRIRRRMTLVARLYSHASQQIISMKDQPDLVAAACDAVVRRLCVGLWRFLGVKTDTVSESA